MQSTRDFSSICLILVLCFSSCLVSRVSSRACYVCQSTINETCFTDAERGAFKMDCVKSITEVLNRKDESSEHLVALIKGYSGGYTPESITDFECVTFIGAVSNVNTTVKACVPRTKDCATLEESMRASSGFLSDSCVRCNTSLCNTQNPYVIQEEIPTQPTYYQYSKNHAKTIKSDFLRVGFLYAVVFLVTTLLRL